jgi:dGTPase
MVTELFEIYLKQPERMPRSYQAQAREEPLHRVVCDYIAGMTDTFLRKQHAEATQ